MGKNTADAYLKNDGNSAAAQHFIKPEKKRKDGDKKGGILGSSVAFLDNNIKEVV